VEAPIEQAFQVGFLTPVTIRLLADQANIHLLVVVTSLSVVHLPRKEVISLRIQPTESWYDETAYVRTLSLASPADEFVTVVAVFVRTNHVAQPSVVTPVKLVDIFDEILQDVMDEPSTPLRTGQRKAGIQLGDDSSSNFSTVC
jgi:hypothetical protein